MDGADPGLIALGPDCAAQPDPHCANPIDAVLVPMYRGIGLRITDASADEYCRRLAIDLIGRVLDENEQRECASAADAGARFDLMLSRHENEYVRTQRRAWSTLLGYDSQRIGYRYLTEMDALVDAAHRDGIAYGELITQIVVHPGFVSRNMNDDWARGIARLAFNRNARQDEIRGMRTMSGFWTARGYADGGYWWNARLATGSDLEADRVVGGNGTSEILGSFCACSPSVSTLGCRTTAWGAMVDFGSETCIDSTNAYGIGNLVHTTEAAAGTRSDLCGDGTTRNAGCRDRSYSDTAIGGVFGVTTPLPPARALTDSERMRLRSLGAALVARGDFWEAGVDRELRRMLGWWQSGVRRPDYDVPGVRAVLAADLRAHGSLRRLHRLITTSLLYAAPAAIAPDVMPDPPLWAMGPTKFLAGESWMMSVEAATGTVSGRCDFRYLQSGGGPAYQFIDPALPVERVTSTVGFGDETFIEATQSLGGCAVDVAPATLSSLGTVNAQRQLAVRFCALGAGVLPQGFSPSDTSDGALSRTASAMVRRILARNATDAEAGELASDMRSCLAAGATTGCGSAESAARWLCTRLIHSAAFATY